MSGKHVYHFYIFCPYNVHRPIRPGFFSSSSKSFSKIIRRVHSFGSGRCLIIISWLPSSFVIGVIYTWNPKREILAHKNILKTNAFLREPKLHNDIFGTNWEGAYLSRICRASFLQLAYSSSFEIAFRCQIMFRNHVVQFYRLHLKDALEVKAFIENKKK